MVDWLCNEWMYEFRELKSPECLVLEQLDGKLFDSVISICMGFMFCLVIFTSTLVQFSTFCPCGC